MANSNTPLGFKPSRYADGQPYNGSTTTYKIADSYGTAIYAGDLVNLTAGYINKVVVGALAVNQIRGVAVGFSWVDAAGIPHFSAYWPAGTVTQGALGGTVEVVDDPKVVFEAVITNNVAATTQAKVGGYFTPIDNGGNAANGLSGEGIDGSATVAGGTFRFMGFTNRPDNDSTSAYARGLFMPVKHDFNVINSAV